MKYYAGIGSRETPEDVCNRFTDIGKQLQGLGWILRSGGADGADLAFEKEVIRKEIYLPWRGFNGSNSRLFNPPLEAFKIAETYHPNFRGLKPGAQKLMARNSQQVLGKDLDSPSSFIVCWTEDGKEVGGTSQAIRIARAYDIPVYNFGSEEGEVLFSIHCDKGLLGSVKL